MYEIHSCSCWEIKWAHGMMNERRELVFEVAKKMEVHKQECDGE